MDKHTLNLKEESLNINICNMLYYRILIHKLTSGYVIYNDDKTSMNRHAMSMIEYIFNNNNIIGS